MLNLVLKRPLWGKFRGIIETLSCHNLLCQKFAIYCLASRLLFQLRTPLMVWCL